MSTQAEFLANPSLLGDRVVLAELRPREILRGWAATAGRVNVYEIAWGAEWGPAHCRRRRTIEAVREGGVLLSEQASVADVEATPGSWYWDPAASLLYMQGAGGDPDAGDTRPNVEWIARFSTRADGPDWDDHAWDPRLNLSQIPEINLQGIHPLAAANIATTAGSLRLDNGDGLFDELLYDCGGLGGARLRLLLGSTSLAYGEFKAIFSGQVTATTRSDAELVCELRPMASVLNGSLPQRVFTEAAYPGCREEVLGQVVPLMFGPVEGIKPPMVRSKKTDWLLRFDGSSYAKRTNAAGIDPLKIVGSISMGGVIYLDNLDGNWGVMGRWGAAGSRSWLARVLTDGKLRIYLSIDGTAIYYFQTAAGAVDVQRETEWSAVYNVSTQLGSLVLDGVEVPVETSGTAPAAIFAGTADFELGAYNGGTDKFAGYQRRPWVAEGVHRTRPDDATELCDYWGGNGLTDLSSRAMHLTQVGGIDESDIEDTAGGNPAKHKLRLNDGVTNELLSCSKSVLADNLENGFVIQHIIEGYTGSSHYYAAQIVNSPGQFQFRTELSGGKCNVKLSSSGSAWTYECESTVDWEYEEQIKIKIIYHGASAICLIYINDIECTTTVSGAVPAACHASTADLVFGNNQAGSAGGDIAYEEIAISSNHAGQINGDDIVDIDHRWRFEPENIYESGGSYYVADDFGGCPLLLNNCDPSNLVYSRGGDVYVVADRQAQSVMAIDRAYYESGEREIELVEGTDYAWDEEDCALTVYNENAGTLVLDAQGVSCGEIYAGIAGRKDSWLATTASDAILWLLQLAGVESGQVDLEAAAAARMGDKAVGFYLDSATSITQLVQRLCLSGCLLDLVVDDEFRLYRWAPDLIGPTSVAGEEFLVFQQPADTSRLYRLIRVSCAAGTAQAEAAEAAELHGITAIKDVQTFLLGLSDAQLLADRLALLAARPPLAVRGTLGNLRLYALRPGDSLLVTRAAALGPGGTLAAYPMVIERLQLLAAKGELGIEASDWRGAGPRTAKIAETGYPDYADCDVVERHSGGFVDNGVASAAEGQRCF